MPVRLPIPERQRRKAERPGEVLEAALDSIAATGFANVRMEDIARRAGVSKGTVYLYFPSKQALFEALVRHAMLPKLEEMGRLVESATESGLDGAKMDSATLLRRVLTAFPTVMADRRVLAIPRLVIAEAHQLPDIARFYKAEVVDRGHRLITGLLQRGVARGEFRPHDCATVARLALAPLLMGLIWRNSFEPATGESLDVDAMIGLHLDLLFQSLAPSTDGAP